MCLLFSLGWLTVATQYAALLRPVLSCQSSSLRLPSGIPLFDFCTRASIPGGFVLFCQRRARPQFSRLHSRRPCLASACEPKPFPVPTPNRKSLLHHPFLDFMSHESPPRRPQGTGIVDIASFDNLQRPYFGKDKLHHKMGGLARSGDPERPWRGRSVECWHGGGAPGAWRCSI